MTSVRRKLSPLARIALGVLALPFLYLVPVNIGLNVGLLPAIINQKPENLMLGWSSAWSPWPGRVYIRGFHLRFQDPGAQWELTIDRATTQVVLGELLEQTFQTQWVRASGVAFRFRPRVPKDTTPEMLAPYPPITGFDTNYLPDIPVPPPPNPWTVRLEQITVQDAREVWIAAYRARIDAEVTQGRVELHPDRSIRVGPAHLQLKQGTVTLGTVPVLDSLNGSIDCSLDVKDILQSLGAKVLKSTDATLRLAGSLHSAAFLSYHLPIELAGGDGWLTVNASIARGVLLAGSKMLLTSDALVIPVSTYQLSGPLRIEGSVEQEGSKARSIMGVTVAPFHLRDEGGAKRFESPGVRLNFTATDLLLGEAPSDGAMTLDLNPTAPFPLRRANSYIGGAAFKVDGGEGVLDASVHAGGDALTPDGAINLRANRLQATFEHTQVRGDTVARLRFSNPQAGNVSADLSGTTVEISHVIVGGKPDAHPWSGKVNLEKATVALSPTAEVHAHVTGAFSNALPFLSMFGDKAGFPKWATPLFEAKGLKASGTLALDDGKLVLRDLKADGEGLTIRGLLDLTEKEISCVFLVTVQGFQIGLKKVGDKVDAEIFNAAPWFKDQTLAMEARK